ncbi:MAG: hypothetical protein U0X58_07465 [Flavobacteriaceae bacterium]
MLLQASSLLKRFILYASATQALSNSSTWSSWERKVPQSQHEVEEGLKSLKVSSTPLAQQINSFLKFQIFKLSSV